MDTKQIQAAAAEIYIMRSDGLDFCSPREGRKDSQQRIGAKGAV
jgi:hypothetical protein